VLALGTRLSDFTTASMTAFQHPDVRFVGLNVAPFDAHKLGALALVADARVGLEALAAALAPEFAGTASGYRAEIADLKHAWDATVDDLRRLRPNGALAQAEVIGIVNEAVGARRWSVNAAGSLPGDLLKLWRPHRPEGLPPRVRLLLHGVRDPGRDRDQAGGARARGGGVRRRRQLPDDELRDRHRRGRGPGLHDRAGRQRGLPVDPRPAAVGR
jgi:hypothetical protein